jgi:hypothetical protein
VEQGVSLMKLARNMETLLRSFIHFYCFDEQIGDAGTGTRAGHSLKTGGLRFGGFE